MQYVNTSINAVGSNTPGAASSAADLEAQEAPKSRPKPQNIDVENFGIFLEGSDDVFKGFFFNIDF